MNTGEIIRYLRNNKKYTQKELADKLGCTREFISQLERNKCSVPKYYILPLSKFLNHDIQKLIKESDKYKKFNHYIISCKLISFIETKDNYEMSILLRDEIVINEFNYGEPEILKLYCTSLVERFIKKDVKASIKTCMEILKIDKIDNISSFTLEFNMLERYYSTVLVLGANLDSLAMHKMHKKLIYNTIVYLEENIFNSTLPKSSISYFFKKFYIMVLNNYAHILFNDKKYLESLIYCNKAIKLINIYNMLFILELVIKLKVEIMYCLGNIDDAKRALVEFDVVCGITNNREYFEENLKEFEVKYKLLFDS